MLQVEAIIRPRIPGNYLFVLLNWIFPRSLLKGLDKKEVYDGDYVSRSLKCLYARIFCMIELQSSFKIIM
jgi:hypothetical protein